MARDFAQRLNRRISIRRAVRTDDGAGGSDLEWPEIAKRWAGGGPSGGAQREQSSMVTDQETWRLDMRPTDILTGDRVVILNGRDAGKGLRVRSVADTTGRNARLVVLADLEMPGAGGQDDGN